MRRAAGKDLSPSADGPTGQEVAQVEREVMAALHVTRRVRLVHWYVSLAPSWLQVEPPLRRLLMLRTHQWIVECVLTPQPRDMPPAAEDLKPGGALVQSLIASVPPDQLDEWRGWIRLVVLDLKRALRWAPAMRNEAWAHWLFLIPYSAQAGRP